MASATVVAQRQASAGARDGVKGKGRTLGARAPLHALVRRRLQDKAQLPPYIEENPSIPPISSASAPRNASPHSRLHTMKQRSFPASFAGESFDATIIGTTLRTPSRGNGTIVPSLSERSTPATTFAPRPNRSSLSPTCRAHHAHVGGSAEEEPVRTFLVPRRFIATQRLTVCVYGQPEGAERQASAGARDGVKGKRNDLAARAPLHALVRQHCQVSGSASNTGGLSLSSSRDTSPNSLTLHQISQSKVSTETIP